MATHRRPRAVGEHCLNPAPKVGPAPRSGQPKAQVRRTGGAPCEIASSISPWMVGDTGRLNTQQHKTETSAQHWLCHACASHSLDRGTTVTHKQSFGARHGGSSYGKVDHTRPSTALQKASQPAIAGLPGNSQWCTQKLLHLVKVKNGAPPAGSIVIDQGGRHVLPTEITASEQIR